MKGGRAAECTIVGLRKKAAKKRTQRKEDGQQQSAASMGMGSLSQDEANSTEAKKASNRKLLQKSASSAALVKTLRKGKRTYRFPGRP